MFVLSFLYRREMQTLGAAVRLNPLGRLPGRCALPTASLGAPQVDDLPEVWTGPHQKLAASVLLRAHGFLGVSLAAELKGPSIF